jgi:hypothetical protein
MKTLDIDIWLPNVWFFLRTVAHTYPNEPNATTKRKYYDFIQNLPLFLPDDGFSNRFVALLDSFPVSPYLDNRDSFFVWIHIMENRVNQILGKPAKTHFEHMDSYYRYYEPKTIVIANKFHIQKKYIYTAIILGLTAFIFTQYRNI